MDNEEEEEWSRTSGSRTSESDSAECDFDPVDITDGNIREAVRDWLLDQEDAVRIWGNIEHWNVSQVTKMDWLFASESMFDADLSRWDVSQVNDMRGMFSEARHFSSDLSRWNVCNVTQMQFMFYQAKSFSSDLSLWDVSSVTNMQNMFEGATSFSADLSDWAISALCKSNMTDMLKGSNVQKWWNITDLNIDNRHPYRKWSRIHAWMHFPISISQIYQVQFYL